MKNILFLILFGTLCLNASDKVPEDLVKTFLLKRLQQESLSNQNSQLLVALPKIAEQYTKVTAEVAAAQKAIDDFCISKKLESKADETGFSCVKPPEKKKEDEKK